MFEVDDITGGIGELDFFDNIGFVCVRLTTLPEDLGNLTSLTTLELSRCESLTILPEGLGNLTCFIICNDK